MAAIMPRLVERELTTEGPRGLGASGNRAIRPRRSVTVNLAESPLSWLHARGHLDDRLFAASEMLRRDYERAGLPPAVTMRWSPVKIKGAAAGLHPTQARIAAKERFDGAVAAAGKGLADILWRVVCAGETLPMAERELGWPIRSGKLVLRLALDRVADFYRIG